jgi:uncharacterized protein (TIGR03435 family)
LQSYPSLKIAILVAIVLPFLLALPKAPAQVSTQSAPVASPTAPPATSEGVAAGASAAKSIAFDVVSIKLNKSGGYRGGAIFPDDGDGMILTAWTLEEMIKFDYAIHREPGLVGLPDWASKDRYDVEAKVGESDVAAWRKLSGAGRRLVLRSLLADSFQLKMQNEDRDLPIYSLVLAKNGPKDMKETKPADLDKDLSRGMDGTPLGGWVSDHRQKPGEPMHAHQMSMGYFLFWLNQQGLGRPVYNHTGLDGNYDFTLQFDPALTAASPNAVADSDSNAAGGPSIFTALQEQIGLRLEPTRGPVPVMVVERVERPATN